MSGLEYKFMTLPRSYTVALGVAKGSYVIRKLHMAEYGSAFSVRMPFRRSTTCLLEVT